MKPARIILTVIAAFALLLLALPLLCGCGAALTTLAGGDRDFPKQYRWTRAVTFGFPTEGSATDIRGASLATLPVRSPDKWQSAVSAWVSAAGVDCDSAGVCTPRLTVTKSDLAGQHADIDIVSVEDGDLTRPAREARAQPGTLVEGTDGKLTRAVPGDTSRPRVVVIEEWEEDSSGRATGNLLALCSVYLPDASTNYLGRAVVQVRSDVSGDLLTGVALHEIGHALGLMHSDRFADAMYALVFGIKTRMFGLTANDQRRIRALYAPLGA